MRRRAFTLIELIASIVILGALAAAIAPVVSSAGDAMATGAEQRRAAETARLTLERVIRAIEAAGATTQAAQGGLAGLDALVIVNDAGGTPDAQEQRRIDLFTAWGMTVATMSASDTQANLLAAAAAADVVYISEVVVSGDLNTKLRDTPTGVVNEEAQLVDEFLMATSVVAFAAQDTLTVTDATHPITSAFGLGDVAVLGRPHIMTALSTNTATHAPGLQILASLSGWPAVAVLDAGAAGIPSGNAAGRRVLLSVGATPMQFEHVSADGLRLIYRAMEWAATGAVTEAPAAVSGAQISAAQPTRVALTGGDDISLTGTTLWLTPNGGAPAILAEGVTAFDLTYVGDDGVTDASATPDQIRRVDIRLVVGGFELRGAAAVRAWRHWP